MAKTMQPCRHHWICEPPNGQASRSRCKKCGEVRTFQNYPSEELHDINVATWKNQRGLREMD